MLSGLGMGTWISLESLCQDESQLLLLVGVCDVQVRTTAIACAATSSFSVCSKSHFGECTLAFLRINQRAHIDTTQSEDGALHRQAACRESLGLCLVEQ